MSAQVCAHHPETPASYRCQGCNSLLCTECIEEGHALLLCRHCGEQASPLHGSQPSTTTDLRRQKAVTKPYNIAEAFLFPFRGMGLYVFISGVLCLALVNFLVSFGFFCMRFFFYFGFLALLIALQFKIVRTTSDGDNELPDWPDFFDLWERFLDLLTYFFLSILSSVPVIVYTLVIGLDKVITTEPSLVFWAGFAVCAWLGAALYVMAFGAAGIYGGLEAIRFDLHFKGFMEAGADAVNVANLLYGLGIVSFILQAILGNIPLVGMLVGSLLSVYWSFVTAHLVGIVYRRHRNEMEALYG